MLNIRPQDLEGKAWRDVPDDMRRALTSLLKDDSGGELPQFAAAIRIKPGSLERNLWRVLEAGRSDQLHAALDALPEMPGQLHNDHAILETENCIVSSDWEIPNADPFFMRAQLYMAYRFDIRDLIINGDFVANDMSGINGYEPLYAEDDRITFGQQLRVSRGVLEANKKWYERIYATSGNHERKANRATRGQLSIDFLLAEAGLEMTRYAHMWVRLERGWAEVNHPRNYVKDSVVLGRRLYNNAVTPDETKPIYIILGHTHQAQQGLSEDGLCEIYGLGCVRHPDKAAYANRERTTHPRWSQSFLVIKDGKVLHQFRADRWEDYEFWLGAELYEELVRG